MCASDDAMVIDGRAAPTMGSGRRRLMDWWRREEAEVNIEDAQQLLCSANRRGIRIPADVVSIVVRTRRAYVERNLDVELETKFWNAYGILRSSIEPATRARRMYRVVFYCTLVALLAVQFYFLVGAEVRDQITQLRQDTLALAGQMPAPAEAAAVVGTATAAGGAPAPRAAVLPGQIEQTDRDLAAYNTVAGWLVPWTGFFETAANDSPELRLAALRMVLNFLATYVLPALYGLLGACAFVLRQLSDEIGKLRFANDLRVQYTLRLNIGLLAGLAVGWFVNPGEGASVIANLSPLALAFVAGYGSDLLFAVLDRVVNAFSPSRGDASETREQVWGGLETVTERRTETRVVGSTDGAETADGATGEAAPRPEDTGARRRRPQKAPRRRQTGGRAAGRSGRPAPAPLAVRVTGREAA